MGVSTASIALLFGLIASYGFGQSSEPPESPAINDYYIVMSEPGAFDPSEAIDPSAVIYLKLFNAVKSFGVLPLSTESRTSLDLRDGELRSLLAITADLAAESRSLEKQFRPLVFEARMEITESDAVSPSLREKIRELDNRWSRTILDHARQLRSAWGEARFQIVDDFIRSGRPIFEKTPQPMTAARPEKSTAGGEK